MSRKMKNSGVEWIGEIPESWDIQRGKFIFIKLSRSVQDNDEVITCFRDGEVTLRKNRREEGFTFSDKEIGYQGIEPGDLVVHGMDGFAGSIGISDSRGKATPVLNVLDTKYSKLYYMYYLRSMAYGDVFTAIATGIRVRSCNLNWNKLGELSYPVPSANEQKNIANYIKTKCTAIDTAIEKTKKSIEKLEEYKKAVITKAVTKGIDPNAKMKDSGVEWIGEIPEGWEILRIKNVAWLKGRIGWDGLKANEFQNDGPFLITGTDFKDGYINWDTCVHITEERYAEDELLHIRENDLLITKDGTVGKLAIVQNCPDKVSLNSGVMIIRNIGKFKYQTRFMYYTLMSNVFKDWFDAEQKPGSTIKHLYQHQFYEFKIPYLNNTEQTQIVHFLDRKCTAIDTAIEKTKKSIEKLEEYKKSLIYYAVTGKIDCRKLCQNIDS